MDKALFRLAEQLAAFDEASLTAFWDKYEGIVREFQPTKQWELAVVVLGMIQVLRWKNHLFNHHWQAQQQPVKRKDGPSPHPVKKKSGKMVDQSKPAKVLPFILPKVE